MGARGGPGPQGPLGFASVGILFSLGATILDLTPQFPDLGKHVFSVRANENAKQGVGVFAVSTTAENMHFFWVMKLD